MIHLPKLYEYFKLAAIKNPPKGRLEPVAKWPFPLGGVGPGD
jgi:hypothetical protein